MVWYGMVWYGMVWYALLCFALLRQFVSILIPTVCLPLSEPGKLLYHIMRFSSMAVAVLVAFNQFSSTFAAFNSETNITSYDSADAIALTQNTLLNLRGAATSQAQVENALFPVLNAPTSFFPVANNNPTPQYTYPYNPVNSNFAAIFANFNGGFGGFFGY
jgi:hypothetical protein